MASAGILAGGGPGPGPGPGPIEPPEDAPDPFFDSADLPYGHGAPVAATMNGFALGGTHSGGDETFYWDTETFDEPVWRSRFSNVNPPGYPSPGTPNNFYSELELGFGRQLHSLLITYDLWVEPTYMHGSGISRNNKVWVAYRAPYGAANPIIGWNWMPPAGSTGGPDDSSTIEFGWDSDMGEQDRVPGLPRWTSRNVMGPDFTGRWVPHCQYIRLSSAFGVRDGGIHAWTDGVHDINQETGCGIYSNVGNYLDRMYFGGATNAMYPQLCHIYWRNVKIWPSGTHPSQIGMM